MAQREHQVELSQLGGGGLRSPRPQSTPNGTGPEIRDCEAGTDHGQSSAASTRRPASLPEVSFPLRDDNEPLRGRLHNVPEEIRSIEKSEHEPWYVSIGPYHYQKGGLQIRSELWKQQCLAEVRSFLGENADLLDDTMTRIEAQVKDYYDTSSFQMAKFRNGSRDFRDMMKTDGCFLLIVLGGSPQDVSTTRRNKILWDDQLMWHDIFLYGNQLPFIVVWEIYQLIHQGVNNVSDLLQKMEHIIGNDLAQYTKRKVRDLGCPDHFLHLYHLLLKPTVNPDPQQNNSQVIMVRWWRRAMEYIRLLQPNNTEDRQENGVKVGRWRRATEYSEMLVKFKKRDLDESSDAQCILDIRVRGHLVEIPKLELNPQSWRLLRNLMLLEQANRPHFGSDVVAYCIFISQLASTSADVSFLMKRGIIEHREASDEKAAEKLNKLCSKMVLCRDTENYLKSRWHELDKHCRKWGWRQLAKVRRYKDWNNLMVVLATFAAFILLVCAIVQSVYTVMTYNDQIKQNTHDKVIN